MVEFQPQLGISTVLDSGTSITTYSSHTRSTYLIRFSGSFYLPLPSYRPSISILCRCIISLFNANPPPPLPAWYVVHLDFTHTHHLPAFAACLCAACHMPDSAVTSRDRLPPPLLPSACAQVPVNPWGLHPLLFPLSPLFPRLSLPF